LAKIDKKRKNKASNKDWKHPWDPDAKVTKMKDGRTHLAHKAEHAVDLETGAVVAVTLQAADEGDTTTIEETLVEAAEQLEAAGEEADGAVNELSEVVTDKGYHCNRVLTDFAELDVRSYVSEPQRGRRKWGGGTRQRDAVYGNRRRIKGKRGKRLMKLRAEKVERSFAHCYETGGMRRVHLKGRENVLKRLLIQVGAFNLSIAMRGKLGAGTPRGLADARKPPRAAVLGLVWASWAASGPLCEALGAVFGPLRAKLGNSAAAPLLTPMPLAA
jgi:transposase